MNTITPKFPAPDGNQDAFILYIRDIMRVPLLTRAEETELAARIKEGDAEAREKMITANLRLVVKIAHDFGGLGLSLLDLVSEGNIGLMKAVDRFDAAKGKLSTYAAWWIKQRMRRALANQSRTIRVPCHIVEKMSRFHRAHSQLEGDLGREPLPEELSHELETSAEDVQRTRAAMVSMVSLDRGVDEQEDQSLANFLADETCVPPDRELAAQSDLELLHEACTILSPREAVVLNRRFGLNDGAEETLRAISRELGLTGERVRQIQRSAIRKLRRYIEGRQSAAQQRRRGPWPAHLLAA
jgi:RNA polymerase primary sigma factor